MLIWEILLKFILFHVFPKMVIQTKQMRVPKTLKHQFLVLLFWKRNYIKKFLAINFYLFQNVLKILRKNEGRSMQSKPIFNFPNIMTRPVNTNNRKEPRFIIYPSFNPNVLAPTTNLNYQKPQFTQNLYPNGKFLNLKYII